MEAPLVSVIIPVFNGEKYIKSCLDMMLNQSYKNLEIIVINDGSTDKSSEIVKQYPVGIIEHEINKGLSAARNTGIDASNGTYIHFMDVDDAINTDYYKNLVAAIVETDADIACGGMIHERYRYKTQLFTKKSVLTNTHDKLKATYVGKWGYVWRYLFRTDFLREKNLRFEEGRFIEDLMFSLPAVFYADKLVIVPDSEYYYYYRENSIMTNKDKAHREKRHKDAMYARAFRKEFAKKHNIKLYGVDTGRIAYFLRKLFK